MKKHQVSYETSLKLNSSLFDWFSIEQWLNFIWIQPGAQELTIWLILKWNLIKTYMNPAWSSRAYYLIDSWLKNDQFSYESSLELQSSLFDWLRKRFEYSLEPWRSLFEWSLIKTNQIACESSLELYSSLFDWFVIEQCSSFHMNPSWSSTADYLIDSQLKIIQHWNESSQKNESNDKLKSPRLRLNT